MSQISPICDKAIVISQPMYFPWVGMFEQIILSDIFVIYDDVQFSKGSFTNRVQIKTNDGIKWLSVPLSKISLSQTINQIKIDNSKSWQESQLSFLENTYKKHTYKYDILDIVSNVFNSEYFTIADLSMNSMLEIMHYFSISKVVLKSSELNIKGTSSKRVCDIVKLLAGKHYITGHGAKNYLDHHLFESNGIQVGYMDYRFNKYNQKFGEFTPYVSILDLIATEGKGGLAYINSTTTDWKEFINERA